MAELLLNATTNGGITDLANGDIIFKDIGGDNDYVDNLKHSHTFDAGVGYKVKMEIKNDWATEGSITGNLYDRLGFIMKETSESDWVNGNVPWFVKMSQTVISDNVWGLVPSPLGDDSVGNGWVLPPNLTTLDNITTYSHVSGTADENGFIPINYVGDARFISWNFYSDISTAYRGWEIKITREAIPDPGSELLLNATTNGGITYLANGDIIFKDIGGDNDYENNLKHSHTFDAGVGYKVKMEIKNDWVTEGSLTHVLYDRLGFTMKETSESDWVNGNVPWFVKMSQTVIGDNVWGSAPSPSGNDSVGNGWVLPPDLTVLNAHPNYYNISGTADENGFIPINYVGDARFISWNFFSDSSSAYRGWEIKITREAIPGYVIPSAGSDNTGSDNGVACTGNGVYIITNTGFITCS